MRYCVVTRMSSTSKLPAENSAGVIRKYVYSICPASTSPSESPEPDMHRFSTPAAGRVSRRWGRSWPDTAPWLAVVVVASQSTESSRARGSCGRPPGFTLGTFNIRLFMDGATDPDEVAVREIRDLGWWRRRAAMMR